jgi:hypothetical protein
LPHQAFAHNPEKQRGWNLFAGLPYRFKTLYAKSSYAPGHRTGLLFFRIFPEALLLTRKLHHYSKFYG